MRNILSILIILFFIQCKKSQSSVSKNEKEFVFDYNKESTIQIENLDLFLLKDEYKLENYLISITKEEYVRDSTRYINDIKDEKSSSFDNDILQTNYGRVKFIPYTNKSSDAFVEYGYWGFSQSMNSYLMNVKLYGGEKTLIINGNSYQNELIDGKPIISPNKKNALTYKDDEGISSHLSLYHINDSKIKHYTTLWSETVSLNNVLWSQNNEMILKTKNYDSGSNLYFKIKTEDLRSSKSKNSFSTEKNKNWLGEYRIITEAKSRADDEKVLLKYYITIDSPYTAILSIGADKSEDYWCEGDYNIENESNVLHAKGKCDEDDINDFFLKQENGKYYIKSKRFLNPDWQELTKD